MMFVYLQIFPELSDLLLFVSVLVESCSPLTLQYLQLTCLLTWDECRCDEVS